MADKITVTSKNSYGSRVKNSFGRILGGFLFVIGSIILLARNEHNFIEQKKALEEGAELVQEAECTQIDENLNKKEVHMIGETFSDAKELSDETFGIVVNDLKLARNVSMYQWKETTSEDCNDNLGGSETCETTYSYSKTWSDDHISSDNFYESAGHQNPTTWKFESVERKKSPIMMGKFTLSDTFVDLLDNFTALSLSDQNVNLNGGTLNGNYIYIGNDEENPAVGDLKITFSSVKTGTVSIIGMQYDDTLTSYITSNNRSIALLEEGKVDAETMFIHAQNANKILTWVLRFVGLLLMYMGFSMIFEFIETLMKLLPFLANIIGVGTKLIALCLTIVLGFLTIGISRLAVRPVIGISCLVLAAGGIVLLVKYRKSKKSGNTDKPQKISKGGDDFEVIENKKDFKDSDPKDVEVIEC